MLRMLEMKNKHKTILIWVSHPLRGGGVSGLVVTKSQVSQQQQIGSTPAFPLEVVFLLEAVVFL